MVDGGGVGDEYVKKRQDDSVFDDGLRFKLFIFFWRLYNRMNEKDTQNL